MLTTWNSTDRFRRAELQEQMQPRKLTKITDATGWTRIVYGPSNAINANHLSSHSSPQQISDRMPLDQVLEDHARYLKFWENSDCWRNLADFIERTIVKSKHLRLANCVCLGLGSISAGRASSKHQLAALTTMLCLLGKTHHIQKVVFQDPAFNDVDKAFLTQLGYSVVSTPIGFNTIDQNTFCYAPHLENELFAMALRDIHPAMCIGNSEVLKDRPLHSSATVSNDTLAVFRRFIEATYSKEMPEYDQDSWCQFTNIYWLREDAE